MAKFLVGAANHYNLMTEFWVADTPPNADTSRCIKWSYNEGKVEFRIELVTGKNTSSSWGVNSSATIRVRKDSHHWHLFTLLFTIGCAFDRFNYILLITLLFKGYSAMLQTGFQPTFIRLRPRLRNYSRAQNMQELARVWYIVCLTCRNHKAYFL